MTDLATLGIRVESQEVGIADQRLDDLTTAATRAEGATNKLSAAARGQGAAQMVANTAMVQQQRTLMAVRGSMGLTASEGLNLSRQFADIGVTAAMGMNPLMIAIQQGPQIMDTFRMAATRAGTSIIAVMRGVAAATWTALAPFLPLIAAVGAAAAIIGGALALSTRALNKEFGDLTVGMGLTEDQLEKVQNKGVTMGDVVSGTLAYLADIITDRVGPAVKAIGDWFSETMDAATSAMMTGTRFIVGGFIGSYRAIKGVWGQLPAVMGDVAVSAANAVVRAVEGMINGAVAGINVLIGAAKGLALVNPAFASAQGMSLISPVALREMANTNAGAARAAGHSIGADFAAGFAEAAPFLDRQAASLGGFIRGAAERRIRSEAGDGGSERATGGAGAEREARVVREHLTRIENVDLQPLRGALIELVEPLKLIADEMRLIDQLAQDTARGLSSAFGESGRALGDLLTAMSGYQSRLAEIDLAEREYRLNAVQAERERSHAQIGHYGDMASAARGFFAEGSEGYRTLLAVEQVYRAFQLAGMIQSMALGGQETAAAVANSMAKGAASAAAGAAKMFEALGPYAFPLVAGMIGLLAGLGLGSRGGGGGSPGAPRNASDSPEASTASVRALGARDAATRDSATAAIASKVDVRVTADRDGIHAYIANTAKQEAVGVAAPMVAAASAGMKKDVMKTLQGQQVGSRRATV